jgi:hypothetical protein
MDAALFSVWVNLSVGFGYLLYQGGKVRELHNTEKQYVLKIFVAGCIAFCTTGESFAADRSKSGKRDVREEKIAEIASTDKPFEFLLGAGYRTGSLNWSEAGGSVNVLSELKWENLNISQISAATRLNIYSGWNLRGKFAYGSINSGTNQDSDYHGNNRTLEFSRSNNKGGGEVRDTSIGLGRTLRLLNYAGKDFLFVTPLVGMSIHQQNLTMTDGFQTVPATGPFPGLNSSYDAEWRGSWVGMDALLESGENWSLTATGEYHWTDYTAHANWNLRPDFSHPVSFVHTAKGQGIIFAAGATYLFSKDWRVGFSVEAQRWNTGAGIDHTFFADGSVGHNPLNGVNWESAAINLGVIHGF